MKVCVQYKRLSLVRAYFWFSAYTWSVHVKPSDPICMTIHVCREAYYNSLRLHIHIKLAHLYIKLYYTEFGCGSWNQLTTTSPPST